MPSAAPAFSNTEITQDIGDATIKRAHLVGAEGLTIRVRTRQDATNFVVHREGIVESNLEEVDTLRDWAMAEDSQIRAHILGWNGTPEPVESGDTDVRRNVRSSTEAQTTILDAHFSTGSEILRLGGQFQADFTVTRTRGSGTAPTITWQLVDGLTDKPLTPSEALTIGTNTNEVVGLHSSATSHLVTARFTIESVAGSSGIVRFQTANLEWRNPDRGRLFVSWVAN